MDWWADWSLDLGSPQQATRQPVSESESFPQQWQYIASTDRFQVVVCSRRSGKTIGAVKRALRICETAGARVLYLTMIRRNARKYFFDPIINLAAGAAVNQTDLTVKFPNGAYIEAGSCLDEGDVDRHRGDAWNLVILDEAQSFRDHVMRRLIDEVIMPSLAERRGSLDLLGTPPPAGPVGYLYEVWKEQRFARRHWTLFENPFFPRGEIEEVCRVRGLTPEHPIYRREYLGEFAVDTESLVYTYDAQKNAAPERPEPANPQWRYSMGIDLGFQDRDAIVVLGWRRDDPDHRLWECYSWQKNHLDVDQLAVEVVATYKRFRPESIVGDTGGHGAVKVLKSLSARLGDVAIASKPASVADSIALVNDDLRAGRLLLRPGGDIVHDMALVTWQSTAKDEVSDSYHSDVLDACRYAHWGARHYLGKAPAPPPTLDELRMQRSAWRRQVANDPYSSRRWVNRG